MALHRPAASRPKLTLLAAFGAGAGLLLAHPAHAATDDGSLLTSNRSALLDDGRQIRASILRHSLIQAAGGARDDGLWTSTWGHWGDHDGDARTDRLRSNGGGVVGGVDREVGDIHIGAIAGAGNLTARAPGGNIQSQSSVVGAYVATERGHWEWQGGVSYSWSQMDSHRRTSAGVASARYNGGIAQAWVDGGYRFNTARGSITPFANLARAQLFQDAVDESNALDALHADGTHGHVDIGTLGVRGAMSFQDGVVGHAGIGYQHAWGDDVRPTDHQRLVVGGDPMQAIGVPTPRNAAVADLGIAFATSKGTSVDASYRGMFGGGAKDQGLRVSVTIKW
ncbi:autotransporter outer membrane beta-barrel domain-containing protein [Bacillus sp. NP157]|nr:autotransporter outer membrane beta-barrel domain-containing protein [Bacillus sp. NP157]